MAQQGIWRISSSSSRAVGNSPISQLLMANKAAGASHKTQRVVITSSRAVGNSLSQTLGSSRAAGSSPSSQLTTAPGLIKVAGHRLRSHSRRSKRRSLLSHSRVAGTRHSRAAGISHNKAGTVPMLHTATLRSSRILHMATSNSRCRASMTGMHLKAMPMTFSSNRASTARAVGNGPREGIPSGKGPSPKPLLGTQTLALIAHPSMGRTLSARY